MVATKLVCFDTAVVDLTDDLADPVEVLFGIQLGGGTDIDRAIAYCEGRIERPSKAHLILISDMYEGGNANSLVDRLARLTVMGVNVIVLLALTDSGRPSYDPQLSARVAALGVPVFACTPDQFPDMMATAPAPRGHACLGGGSGHQADPIGRLIGPVGVIANMAVAARAAGAPVRSN